MHTPMETDGVEWDGKDADDCPRYPELCRIFERPLLTKSELVTISHQTAAAQGIKKMGRPYIRLKSGVMTWIYANWAHADRAIQEGNVHLPIKKRMTSLSATDIKKKTKSKSHSQNSCLRSFLVNQPGKPPRVQTPEPPTFEIPAEDYYHESDNWTSPPSFDDGF
jgi:hypothetical protein